MNNPDIIIDELKKNIENSFETFDYIKQGFLDFINKYPNNYNSRENPEGHVTASILVVDQNKENVLLTHHAKYNRWLQLGGHWDQPGENCLQAALREMKEEGFDNQMPQYTLLNDAQPLDIDIHWIGDHYHFDVCFIAEVNSSQSISCSNESHDVAWKKIDDMMHYHDDERLIRMLGKTKDLLINKSTEKTGLKL